MPAFLVGEGYANVLALSHGVACHSISHQENHILAGIWSAGGPRASRYLAVHVSGGTTEITAVDAAGAELAVTLLGGSRDIAAGQFVDRIGVALGLPFPAGPHLEVLAREGHAAPAAIPAALDGMTVSFSGPETHARRLLERGAEPAAVAAGIERCVAESLAGMISAAVKETGIKEILLVGGVTANSYIRSHLTAFCDKNLVNLYQPRREYSSDNAVGAAYYAVSR